MSTTVRKGSPASACENTLIYGFTSDIATKISSISKGKTICLPVDMHESTAGIGWQDFMRFRQLSWDDRYCDEREYRKLLRHTHVLVECYSRHFWRKQDPTLSIQDYLYIIRSHYVAIKKAIFQLNPIRVIFSNLPHEGFDNILHIICHLNGITTFSCFQVPFAPRFFFGRLDDNCLGYFNNLITCATNEEYEPEAFVEEFISKLAGVKEYFYMEETRPLHIPSTQDLIKSCLFYIGAKQHRLQPVNLASRALSTTLAIAGHQRYLKRRKQITSADNQIDLSNGYIYLPLHLQPELTTSSLGSIYCDQTIVISKAAQLAHKMNCVVLCKDNPKQSYSHRSNLFYEACRSYDNVYFINTSINSRKLVSSSTIVITVNGTAGVEALAMGVPVWCLGRAWWETMNGVAKKEEEALSLVDQYRASLRYSDLAEYRAQCSQRLRRHLCKLLLFSFTGCSDQEYCQGFGLTKSENNKIMAISLSRVLSH